MLGFYPVSGAPVSGLLAPVIPPFVLDYHDGGPEKKRRKRQQEEFDAERERLAIHRREILDAYERIVEGKPPANPAEILDAASKSLQFQYKLPPDKIESLIADDPALKARIWAKFIEMDDEEVLALL